MQSLEIRYEYLEHFVSSSGIEFLYRTQLLTNPYTGKGCYVYKRIRLIYSAVKIDVIYRVHAEKRSGYPKVLTNETIDAELTRVLCTLW